MVVTFERTSVDETNASTWKERDALPIGKDSLTPKWRFNGKVEECFKKTEIQ